MVKIILQDFYCISSSHIYVNNCSQKTICCGQKITLKKLLLKKKKNSFSCWNHNLILIRSLHGLPKWVTRKVPIWIIIILLSYTIFTENIDIDSIKVICVCMCCSNFFLLFSTRYYIVNDRFWLFVFAGFFKVWPLLCLFTLYFDYYLEKFQFWKKYTFKGFTWKLIFVFFVGSRQTF